MTAPVAPQSARLRTPNALGRSTSAPPVARSAAPSTAGCAREDNTGSATAARGTYSASSAAQCNTTSSYATVAGGQSNTAAPSAAVGGGVSNVAFGTGVAVAGGIFFFQAEDGIRVSSVTGVQTCALPILAQAGQPGAQPRARRALPRAQRSAPGAPEAAGLLQGRSARRRDARPARPGVPGARAEGQDGDRKSVV